MFKRTFALLGAATVTIALGACASPSTSAETDTEPSTNEASVLRIGLSPTYPPFEYFDSDEQLVGADVELATAIANEMGRDIEFDEMKFDQLINSVTTGRIDAAMSGMSDTPVRQETGDFVDYFASEGRFYTLIDEADSYTTQEDLCGTTVAVSRTSDYFTQAEELSVTLCEDAGLAPITLLPTDSGGEARLQMEQQRAQLAIQGAENLIYFETEEPGKYAVVADPLPGRAFGIFVQKDSPLADEILTALQALHASGEYDAILDAHGIGHGSMDPVINGTTE